MASRQKGIPSQITAPQVADAMDDSMAEEDCSTAVLDLAALSEGNLSDDGRRRLTGHLRGCAPCRELLVSLTRDREKAGHTEDHGLAPELALGNGKSAAPPVRTNSGE